ncbi:MAG: hypothetical protein U1D55_13325 [Phycisphaerae bacterium]
MSTIRTATGIVVGASLLAAIALARDTTRVSTTSAGGQVTNTFLDLSSISDNGRWVAFASSSPTLVAGDTNGATDVFVKDRTTNATVRVSVATGGGQSNGSSTQPFLSPNGRWVVFNSTATNLVVGDTNAAADIFVHDRDPDLNGIYDEGNGVTTRVSVSSVGAQTDGDSTHPMITPDGRYIVFRSFGTTLVAGDTNGTADIFVKDLASGAVDRVSTTSADAQVPGGYLQYPTISADGRFVAFVSTATTLVAGDTNALADAFVKDRQTRAIERVSVATGGAQATGGGVDDRAYISADGRYVAFCSLATNLVTGDTNGQFDIFVRDRVLATTVRVNLSSNPTSSGAQATGAGAFFPAISADGRYVVFSSQATNLIDLDTNAQADTFVRDRLWNLTSRVSVTTAGAQVTGGASNAPAMSRDGRYVSFSSAATDVISGDTNGTADTFVADTRSTATPQTLRIDSDGASATVDQTISASEYGPGNSYSYAGGGTGFGGVLGSGTLYMNSDSTNLYVAFQPGATLNDIAVLYLDTRAGGFTDNTMFDGADRQRRAVTQLVGSANSAFDPDFLPDFALTIDRGGMTFYELTGGSLTFISFSGATTGQNTLAREFSMALSTLGMTSGGSLRFLMMYTSWPATFPTDAQFCSNESIPPFGPLNSGGNPGSTVSANTAAYDEFVTQCATSPTVSAGGPYSVCGQQLVWLNGVVSGTSTGVTWTSSGSGTFVNANSLNATYIPSAGDVGTTVTLTLTSSASFPCSGVSANASLTVVGPVTANAGSDQSICSNTSASLTGTASNAGTVAWTTSGTGSFSSPSSLSTTYTPSAGDITAGSVTLTLTATAAFPCSGSAVDSLVLTIVPAPTANAGVDQTICAGSTVSVSGSATNAASTVWSTNGDGTFNTPGALSAIYTPGSNDVAGGSVTLTLTASGNAPCANAGDALIVTIVAAPTANAGVDQSICAGSTVSVSGSVTNAASTLWSTSGDGAFNTPGSPSAIYTPGPNDVSSGSVTLTLTANGNAPCANAGDGLIVTIVAAPTANAGADQSICAGSPVSVSGVATNAASTAWTTSGDGGFDTPSSPSAVYTPGPNDVANGSVTLTFTATGNAPCANAVDSLVVTIVAAPTANAGADQTICAGSTVSVSGGASNAASTTWSTSGDGSFDTPASLSAVYTPGPNDVAGGSVTLTLTATGNAPCADAVDSLVATIVAAPTADAGADQAMCAGATVSVSGSASNAVSTAWSTSGDGSFDTPGSLSAIYTPGPNDLSGGSVTLTLTATGNVPCADAVDSLVVTIVAAPTASAGSDQTICAGSTVSVNGSASNAVSTAWSTSGDGSFDTPASLSAVYTPGPNDVSGGSVALTLTATGNAPCTDAVDSLVVTIVAVPTANAGADQSICAGSTVSVSGSVTNFASSLWSTSGDGAFDTPASLSAIYTPGPNDVVNGAVTLTLTAMGNAPCGNAADAMTVTIVAAPTANAGVDQSVCAGSTVSVSGSASNAASTLWTTSGDGTFDTPAALSSVYTPGASDIAAGTVTLTLTATGNSPCGNAADSLVVTINAAPTANAGLDQSVCADSTVSVSGSASNAAATLWTTGGDGTFDTPAALSAVYTPGPNDVAAGSVTLTFTATGNSPCSDAVDSLAVTIVAAPSVDAGLDQTICAGSTASVSGTASNAASTLWTTSGDGGFDTATSLSAVYTPGANDIATGTVTLTLTATGNSPCANAADSLVVTINATSSANAGADQTICAGSTASVSGSAANAASTLWTTSGDGTFDTPAALSAIYTPGPNDVAAGTVTLTFTATGNSPCSNASDSLVVTIAAAPAVDAGSDQSICIGSTVSVSGSASNAASTLWTTSGDGTFDTPASLSAVYTPGPNDVSSGSVTLTLTATANPPCSNATDSLLVTISSDPTASAGSDQTICAGSTVSVSGSASNAGTTLWTTSGDGTFDTPAALGAIYTPGPNDVTSGSVTLTLTATAAPPCTGVASDSLDVTIGTAPVASAGSDQTICEGSTVSVSGSASNAASTLWTTSGDGTFDTPASLNAVYTPGPNDLTSGTVTFTLTATASPPCTGVASDALDVTINAAPTAGAGVDQTICTGSTASVSGSATNAASTLWTTSGDGTFDTPASLSAVYTPGPNDVSGGSVTLTLTANGNAPCTSAADSLVIAINPEPTANAGGDQTICAGSTVSVSGSASNAASTAWTTSGDGTFDAPASLTAVYTPGPGDVSSGSVTLTLTAFGNPPCADTGDSLDVTIVASPTANAGGDQTVCAGSGVSVSGTASNAASTLWSTSGDGTFDAPASLSATYTPGSNDLTNGSVTLTLTATGNAPCATAGDSLVVTFSSAQISAMVVLGSVDASGGPISRCIRVVVKDATTCVPAVSVLTTFTGNPASALVTVSAPCGPTWTQVCLKDEQHTLNATVALVPSGSNFVAATPAVLDGGDTDNDGDVDINDVTYFLFRFGQLADVDACPWTGIRDADFSDNGVIGIEDYSILSANWLRSSGCQCPASILQPGFDQPLGTIPTAVAITSVPVEALPPRIATAVDLDGNGVFDADDVAIFEVRNGLSGELSARMRAATPTAQDEQPRHWPRR